MTDKTILDVSHWQGTPDWAKVAASGQIDGVMLRVLGSKGGKLTALFDSPSPSHKKQNPHRSAVRGVAFLVERSNLNPNHCPLGHLWRQFHRT